MGKVIIVYGENTRDHRYEESVNELLKQGWTVKSVTANPGYTVLMFLLSLNAVFALIVIAKMI